jgi:hypothetical protein
MEVPIDPLFLAHSRFRRRDYDGTIEICNGLLAANPYDQVRAPAGPTPPPPCPCARAPHGVGGGGGGMRWYPRLL